MKLRIWALKIFIFLFLLANYPSENKFINVSQTQWLWFYHHIPFFALQPTLSFHIINTETLYFLFCSFVLSPESQPEEKSESSSTGEYGHFICNTWEINYDCSFSVLLFKKKESFFCCICRVEYHKIETWLHNLIIYCDQMLKLLTFFYSKGGE